MTNQHATARASSGQRLEAAAKALRANLRGELLQPGDEGYDGARLIWNGMFDKKPALIARCNGTADTVHAVNFARENGLLTAVRCGGHNSAGSGSCDGGIMIDLSRMNAVRVDPKARRAWVQGGATWGDFDREAQVHGLATPGGVVSATGVGGLTLAGGLGWLRGKHGLSLDNVLSVDIVTADGQLRTASAAENSDLYWAVRGGGGNFGVVTSFEFQLHPVGPEVMFLGAIYRAEDATQVMKGWRDFMATAPDEIGGTLVEFSTIPTDPEYPEETWGARVMALAGVWAGPAHEGEQAVWPLRDIGHAGAGFQRPDALLQRSEALRWTVPQGSSSRLLQIAVSQRPGRPDDRRDRAARRRSPLRPDALLGVVSGRRRRPGGRQRDCLR